MIIIPANSGHAVTRRLEAAENCQKQRDRPPVTLFFAVFCASPGERDRVTAVTGCDATMKGRGGSALTTLAR